MKDSGKANEDEKEEKGENTPSASKLKEKFMSFLLDQDDNE